MPEPLKIEVLAAQPGGVRILTLSGPCTLDYLAEFKSVLRSDPAPVTILDMTNVSYVANKGALATVDSTLEG